MPEAIPDYDELRLRIEPGAEGSYRVLAFGPDGTTASGEFKSPFSPMELDNFILRVGLPRRSVRAYRSSQMQEAKKFGSVLFDALLQGDVREAYLGARRVAEARHRGLRMTLYLTGTPELMEIPWEFLYERPSFLSQSIYTPVVRSLDLKSVRRPRRVRLPLQILGVVSTPAGPEVLDVGAERNKLESALSSLRAAGSVQLRWLDRATLTQLNRTIAAPDEVHVLHYIGHGAYDQRTESGFLVLEDDQGNPFEVSGEELGSLLYDEHSLRLAVLNSCEGARTSHVDPFSGVAASLIESGIPAVVGMQFEITDEAAITFSEQFYTSLAQGFPVDAAIAHARKAIFAAGGNIEFGTPVLFLRTAEARLFDIEEAPGPPAEPPADAPRVESGPGPPDRPVGATESSAGRAEHSLRGATGVATRARPSRRALALAVVAVIALVATVLAASGLFSVGGGETADEGRVAIRAGGPVDAFAARGELIVWEEPARRGTRLKASIDGKQFELAEPAANYAGVDVGVDRSKTVAVYSRCPTSVDPHGCDIFRSDVATRNERKLPAASKRGCNQHGPAISGGVVSFSRVSNREAGCRVEAGVHVRMEDRSRFIASSRAGGTDTNGAFVTWAAQGAIQLVRLRPRFEIRTIRPPSGHEFSAPTLDQGFVYLVDHLIEPDVYRIARLKRSGRRELEHYGASFSDPPGLAVTGGEVLYSGDAKSNREDGRTRIWRDPAPAFEGRPLGSS